MRAYRTLLHNAQDAWRQPQTCRRAECVQFMLRSTHLPAARWWQERAASSETKQRRETRSVVSLNVLRSRVREVERLSKLSQSNTHAGARLGIVRDIQTSVTPAIATLLASSHATSSAATCVDAVSRSINVCAQAVAAPQASQADVSAAISAIKELLPLLRTACMALRGSESVSDIGARAAIAWALTTLTVNAAVLQRHDAVAALVTLCTAMECVPALAFRCSPSDFKRTVGEPSAGQRDEPKDLQHLRLISAALAAVQRMVQQYRHSAETGAQTPVAGSADDAAWEPPLSKHVDDVQRVLHAVAVPAALAHLRTVAHAAAGTPWQAQPVVYLRNLSRSAIRPSRSPVIESADRAAICEAATAALRPSAGGVASIDLRALVEICEVLASTPSFSSSDPQEHEFWRACVRACVVNAGFWTNSRRVMALLRAVRQAPSDTVLDVLRRILPEVTTRDREDFTTTDRLLAFDVLQTYARTADPAFALQAAQALCAVLQPNETWSAYQLSSLLASVWNSVMPSFRVVNTRAHLHATSADDARAFLAAVSTRVIPLLLQRLSDGAADDAVLVQVAGTCATAGACALPQLMCVRGVEQGGDSPDLLAELVLMLCSKVNGRSDALALHTRLELLQPLVTLVAQQIAQPSCIDTFQRLLATAVRQHKASEWRSCRDVLHHARAALASAFFLGPTSTWWSPKLRSIAAEANCTLSVVLLQRAKVQAYSKPVARADDAAPTPAGDEAAQRGAAFSDEDAWDEEVATTGSQQGGPQPTYLAAAWQCHRGHSWTSLAHQVQDSLQLASRSFEAPETRRFLAAHVGAWAGRSRFDDKASVRQLQAWLQQHELHKPGAALRLARMHAQAPRSLQAVFLNWDAADAALTSLAHGLASVRNSDRAAYTLQVPAMCRLLESMHAFDFALATPAHSVVVHSTIARLAELQSSDDTFQHPRIGHLLSLLLCSQELLAGQKSATSTGRYCTSVIGAGADDLEDARTALAGCLRHTLRAQVRSTSSPQHAVDPAAAYSAYVATLSELMLLTSTQSLSDDGILAAYDDLRRFAAQLRASVKAQANVDKRTAPLLWRITLGQDILPLERIATSLGAYNRRIGDATFQVPVHDVEQLFSRWGGRQPTIPPAPVWIA